MSAARGGEASSSVEAGRIRIGYLLAVTAAMLTFLLHSAWRDIVDYPIHSVPFSRRILEHIFVWMFFGVIFWVYALFTAAWPFAATLALARRYGIRHFGYYVACGAIAGALLTLIVVVPPWMHNLEHDNTFVEEWLRMGRAFAVYGACGGVAFWYKAGRFISRRDAHSETLPSRT